jgi:hypothetical protein
MESAPYKATEIRVNSNSFPANRWREAMLDFLMGIWSGDSVRGPNIQVRGIVLRRNEDTSRFKVDGPREVVDMRGVALNHGRLMMIEDGTYEIECGLIRFVKNDSIRYLAITFDEARATLWFWKGQQRGELYCSLHGARW